MSKKLPQVSLRRAADEIKNYRNIKKVLRYFIAAGVILLILIYIVTILYSSYGAFTVSVMKFDNIKYSLSLSEEPQFLKPTARLNCQAAKEVTNISVDSIPKDVDQINGEHNGDNYVAYTFYCKNTGTMAYDYTYEVFIRNIEKHLDEAVRVRLYVDGQESTFARVRGDGTGPEPGTEPFQTANTVVKKEIKNFNPGDSTKFTVVLWIEGDDPDCLNDKLGGAFKVDMAFEVTGIDEDQN